MSRTSWWGGLFPRRPVGLERVATVQREAVERTIWLAKLNLAWFHYFYVLDVSAAIQRTIEEFEGGGQTVFEQAKNVLRDLVDREN